MSGAAGGSRQAGGVVVSLNGADNVGKTSHVRWLSAALPGCAHAGTIDRYDPAWARVCGNGSAHWWWRCSTSEHVALVMRSHVARRAAHADRPVLEDRGRPMLLATCAATAAVKDNLDPAAALELVTGLAGAYRVPTRPEVHVLLRHADAGPEREAQLAVARDAHPPGDCYLDYQRALAAVLEVQVEQGVYDEVLVRGEQPLLPVQRRIRAVLAEHRVAVRALPQAPLTRVWVLGGLSESGKSTLAELLVGEAGATRLKIGWLLELAACRAGVVDPYAAWSECEQAERLAEELWRFAAANKTTEVTLESAHRLEATAHLRRCLGEVCRVVFVDAEERVRLERAVESPDSLARRDAVKLERGADRIAGIADVVVDNSGSLAALKLALPLLTAPCTTAPQAEVGVACADRQRWEPVTQARWLRAVTEQLVDEHTVLLAATGGTGRARWRPDWSDLDLLLVRGHFPLSWLRTSRPGLVAPNGVKVGLTLLTSGDLAAGRVPPRVVHALRQLAATGGEGELYRRGDYHPPIPTPAWDDRASRGELGLVLMTCRRLLTATCPDVRAVHKHLVLLAKIVLRACRARTDDGDGDAVLADLACAHPDLPPLPGTDQAAALHAVAPADRDPVAVERLLAALAAVIDLAGGLDRILTWRTTP